MKLVVVLTLFWLTSFSALADTYQLQSADRQAVVEAVIEHLETDYVDASIGATAALALRDDVSEDRFASSETGDVFADALSARLQDLTGDGHLNVEFSEKVLVETEAAAEDFSSEQMERWYGQHLNFGVQSAERLDDNIGYLDLRVFPPIDMGGDTVTAAMNVIAHTDALIIDLRKNGGGIGDTADLVASYLFDSERQPLTGIYDRPSDTLSQRYTQPHVPGHRFGGDKPVYVLISSDTFSAAEALAYNLQALDRAKIVGETSAGGAHPFDYQRVHPHFVLWSVSAKSVNPITGGNWQSVGVKPDIESVAADALQAALDDLSRGGEISANRELTRGHD